MIKNFTSSDKEKKIGGEILLKHFIIIYKEHLPDLKNKLQASPSSSRNISPTMKKIFYRRLNIYK